MNMYRQTRNQNNIVSLLGTQSIRR